jgi:preprotein translocase subunit SecE
MTDLWYSQSTVMLVVTVITAFFVIAGLPTQVVAPARRKTAITTAMVFVMVVVASLFFLAADQVMGLVVTYLLGS